MKFSNFLIGWSDFLKNISYEAKNIFVSLKTIKTTNSNKIIDSNAVFLKTFLLIKRAIIKIKSDPKVRTNSGKYNKWNTKMCDRVFRIYKRYFDTIKCPE